MQATVILVGRSGCGAHPVFLPLRVAPGNSVALPDNVKPVNNVSALTPICIAQTGPIASKPAPARRISADAWAARQVYIALGNFLTSAALLGIDTCPMEGIEPARYDEILGLAAQGFQTVVVAAAGYRAGGDKYATLPKVRFTTEEIITHVA
jgi:nitroreductase